MSNPRNTLLFNYLYQLQKTINTLRENLLEMLAIFFGWFSIVFGFGMAILTLIKVAFILFPALLKILS